MSKPRRRRQPNAKKKRPPAPARRTKPGCPKTAPPATPKTTQRPRETESLPLETESPTRTIQRPLRGESLGLTEADDALTWQVIKRRGRPPGGTLGGEEHLRRYPDGTMEDGKPLTVKSRLRKLFDEQGIVVNERTVRRWLAAARRR